MNATINGGFANYSFTGLPVGEYSVTAYYGGGTYFDPVSKDKSFTITQADSSIEIHVLNDVIHVGEAIQVTGIVPSDATGNMSFRITDGKTVNVGETATFDGLTVAGEYTVYAIYNGDKNYKASKEVNTTIKVIKYNLDLDISADNIDYGDDLVVKVNTNTNFTGDVLVKVGDKNQTAHITKGAGNATFVNLTAGEYNITAIFTENKIFNADAKNTTATVRDVVPAAQALNTNVPDNSKSPTFSIKLDKDATGNFTVSIDGGKTFNKTVELINGSASITAENLSVGDHVVILSYSGDGKYAAIIQNTTVSIKEPAKTNPGKDTKQETKKTATKIVAKKKTFKAKKKVKKYTITLKAGKKPVKNVQVTLKIKGKTYKAKTNAKGKAVFKIKNLKKKGKYTATIKFKGNSNYNAATKKVKITVKK